MAFTIPLAASAVGAGASLYNMFGGGQNQAPAPYSVQMPAQWQAPQLTEAAGGAFSTIPSLSSYNLYPGLLPYAQNTFQSLYNNPYAPGAQAGAGTAATMGQNAATGAYDAGAGLYGRGQELFAQGAGAFGRAPGLYGVGDQAFGQAAGLYPQAQRLFEMGFDPQDAYRQRAVQRLTDETRAGQAARGVAMTPYGAGMEAQTLSNFNLDWEREALNRALAGAGGAGSLYGTAGNMIGTGIGAYGEARNQLGTGAQLYGQGAGMTTQGAGLQAGAAPLYMQSAAYPYATAQAIGGAQQDALTGLGQFGAAGAAIPQMQIEDYLKYINMGTGATNAATGAGRLGLTQQELAFNQNQQQAQNQMGYGSQLGGALQQMGKYWPQQWSTGWGKQNLPGAQQFGTPEQLFPGYTGKFADGGRPPVGGPALVGERGPELFVPDQPGTIMPLPMRDPRTPDFIYRAIQDYAAGVGRPTERLTAEDIVNLQRRLGVTAGRPPWR